VQLRGYFPSSYVELLDSAPLLRSSTIQTPALGDFDLTRPSDGGGRSSMTQPLLAGAMSDARGGGLRSSVSESLSQALQQSASPEISRLDALDDPMLKFRHSISRTRYGVFATNLAYGTCVALFLLGICTIVWGAVDTRQATLDELCGVYALSASICIFLYEFFYGAYRGPDRRPIRAVIYALISVFLFFSKPTAIGGACLLCAALANAYTAYIQEASTAEELKEAARAGAIQSIWVRIQRFLSHYLCDFFLVPRPRISRFIFIIAVGASNIVLFVETVRVELDHRHKYSPAERFR